MNNRFLWFLLATILTVSCNRCKDECDDPTNPECPNYEAPVDPCEGAFETSAAFSMRQNPGINGSIPDTLLTFYRECVIMKTITLRASMDSCSYHWIIGANDYYSQEVTFNFSAAYVDQEIPITLVVTRTPQTNCYPNDNGVDSLTKIIVPKYGCDAAIWGTYFGAWDDSPLDSFAVELLNDPGDWPNCGDQIKFINLNPIAPDDTCVAGDLRVLYNYLEIENTYVPCYWPVGHAYLDSTTNRIKIDYSLLDDNINNSNRSAHVFRGYRIN